MPSLIFRKGLDLTHAVAAEVAADYHSALVDRIRDSTHRYKCGRLTVYLARKFGFCYGVDRAVDYAYQTRRRFPHRPSYSRASGTNRLERLERRDSSFFVLVVRLALLQPSDQRRPF